MIKSAVKQEVAPNDTYAIVREYVGEFDPVVYHFTDRAVAEANFEAMIALYSKNHGLTLSLGLWQNYESPEAKQIDGWIKP